MENAEKAYDDQSPPEQAATRRRWDAAFARSRERLNYEERFRRDGTAFSTADAEGNLVRHPAREADLSD
jgi:hypothetical protein